MSQLLHSGSVLHPTTHTHLIAPKNVEFKNEFNKHSFMFEHTLNTNKLFEFGRITELAGRMFKSGDKSNLTAIDFRNASVDAKIRAMPPQDQFAKVLENLDRSGSWIKLTRAQDFDPDYAALLAELTAEIEKLAQQQFQQQVTWSTMTLFLSSPNITTPFHIDHESNFLFQIRGNKQLCLFDASDREVVPTAEIERFYFGNGSAANYREHLQDRGTVYEMKPGSVVHHPPLAPHWVKNMDNISVSLSIAYCLRQLEDRARVYQVNFMMRKMGLKPKPPGVAPKSDAIKTRLLSAFEERKPKSYHDIVYSPVDRLKSPIKKLKSMVRPGA